MTLFLSIGNVVLSGLEIPQELGKIGTRQNVVRNEFPGGIITLKALGAFPHPLSWSGILTGADAFSRSQQLQRIAALGQNVTLSYGPNAWSGLVQSYEATPKHQWLVPYMVAFEPDADLSGIGTVPFDLDSPEVILSGQVSAVTSLIDGDDGLTLPDPLAVGAQALLDTVSAGLLNGNGTVAGIGTASVAAISVAASNLETMCLPYALGTDPSTASPALDLSVQAVAITQTVGNPASGFKVIQTVNPNLFQIAARYYNDATKWLQIAQASGLPPDPQPIGMITLTVPA